MPSSSVCALSEVWRRYTALGEEEGSPSYGRVRFRRKDDVSPAFRLVQPEILINIPSRNGLPNVALSPLPV